MPTMPYFYPQHQSVSHSTTPSDYHRAYSVHDTSYTGGQTRHMAYDPKMASEEAQAADWYDMNKYATKKPVSHTTTLPSLRSTAYGHSEYDPSAAHWLNERRDGAHAHATGTTLPPLKIPRSSQVEDLAYSNYNLPGNRMSMPIAAPAPAPVQTPVKEEKPVGGVAAHLDYEMDQMADFVAEMAQGMYELFQTRICMADIDIMRSVQPSTQISSSFRKYVLQILSSTRLPSSTILLGLHYLATRMGMLSLRPYNPSSPPKLYHMLTTALLLGSKFLDDNTFQNRSWSEVSNISVSELNVYEIQWLVDIKWNMHIDPNDDQGFFAWLRQWETWKAKKAERARLLNLAPIDTSLYHPRPSAKPTTSVSSYSPFGDIFHSHKSGDLYNSVGWATTPRYETWQNYQGMAEHSPPSAPETGPSTPDWYSRHGSVGYHSATSTGYSNRNVLPPLQVLPSQSSAYYSAYPQHYLPTWNEHGLGCHCGWCIPYHERFSLEHTHGMQSVVG
ncbi:hypothetical protein MMC25_003932 [Agyrium rufum]|nr:hypothetical protein [Agyrium rufum]